MQPSNKVQDYIKQVCEQIRWQKAHVVVEEELLAHIEDQKEAFQLVGASAREAEDWAVEEMGSPLETGSHFDRLYRPRVAWNVLLFAGAIIVMGNLLRAGLLLAVGEEFHLIQDFWGLPVGLAAMVLGYWLDYSVLIQKCNAFHKITAVDDLQAFLYLVVSAGLVALLHMFVCEAANAMDMNGSRYFLIAEIVPFNNSYLSLFFPLWFCVFVYRQRGNGWKGFMYSFIFLGFGSFLLYIHTTDLLLMLGVGVVLLCYGLHKNWFGCSKWWGISFLHYPLWLFFFFITKPYRIKRIKAIFNPWHDPLGTGYIPIQVLTALQEANFFGASAKDVTERSLDNSLNLTEHLLTMAISHWGWCILVPLVLIYGCLLWMCYAACRKVKSQMGKFVIVTITSTWIIQLLFYFCNNLSSLYTWDYPLLFVQGNMAMVCNLFLLGLFLSVYKTGAVQKDISLPLVPTKHVLGIQRQELIQRLRLEYTTEEELLAAWRGGQHEAK